MTLQRFVCILTLQKSVLEQTNHLEYLGLVADTAHASVFFPFFFFSSCVLEDSHYANQPIGPRKNPGPLASAGDFGGILSPDRHPGTSVNFVFCLQLWTSQLEGQFSWTMPQ